MVLLALAGAGCSAADNLTYDEIVAEVDGIVTLVPTGPDRRIEYATRAATSGWYMRQFWLVPLRWGLGAVFGARHSTELDNPAGHVRELLVELPDEVGSDLVACSQSVTRFGWIAELDSSVASRIVALDGMAAIATKLELPLFTGQLDQLAVPMDETRLAAARAGVQAGRPEVRGGAFADEGGRGAYLTALAAIVERPLATATARLLLVQDLLTIYTAEPDAAARAATAQALRTAIAHCVVGTLLQTVQGRDPMLVDVRLCAMELVRRLGGPATVPLLLATMAAGPEAIANNVPRFDQDPLIQLRLIHYCGQLRGPLAMAEVRLPGTDRWETIAAADFLAQTILMEQTYFSKLRIPALTALSLCLERNRLDYGQEWVKDWFDQRQRERRS